MSNDLMVCPYNRSHVVAKLRMASHLAKCQENYPNINFATCFFDFLHRVPPEKLKEHLEVCPSKDKFATRFCFDEPIGPVDPDGDIIYLTRRPWKLSKNKNSAKGQEDGTSTTDGSFSYDFATKCSFEASEGQKGKGKGKSAKGNTKKYSKPEEESWETPSLESSDEKTGKGVYRSPSTTQFSSGQGNGSGDTEHSNFQGNNFVNEKGFITVDSKQKSRQEKTTPRYWK